MTAPPPTPQPALRLDSALRRLSLGGRSVELRGRWDTAFLQALIEGRHFTRGRAATPAMLEPALQAFGLRGALGSTQWSRIVERLRAALLRLQPEGHWARRLSHPARGKTTGPWWLELLPGDGEPVLESGAGPTATSVPEGRSVVPPPLALCSAPPGDPDTDGVRASATAVHVVAEFKLALEAIWKADPQHALALLAEGPHWKGESDALAMLRRLRRAEVLSATGAHGRATRALLRVQSGCSDPLLERLFAGPLRLARMRVLYAADPLASFHGLRRELGARLPVMAEHAERAPDTMLWAEKLHLLALCERRVFEDEAGAVPMHAVDTMLRAAHAALLLFLLARCYDRAQHVCANLAYMHQKLARRLGAPHWALAVRWHEVSFGLHASFGGAESSAWEIIYLGELWLDSPEARAACAVPGRGATWEDRTPDRLSFYDHGVAVARQLCDPRQIAYTLLNRYRFALHTRARKARDESVVMLRAHWGAHPDMRALLLREGYMLPR